MRDLDNYINKRKQNDDDFSANYEIGSKEFKIGMMIKQLRLQERMTQEDLTKMNTDRKFCNEFIALKIG